jgi:hypothetical protein
MLRFKTIRYYPSSISDEFFNIGTVLQGETGGKPIIKLLSSEEMHQLPCITAENRSVVEKMLVAFKQHNGLLYGNHVRFSKEQLIESTDSIEQEAETLFFQYVSYKLHEAKPTIDKIAKIRQSAQLLVQQEFSKYLKLIESNTFDIVIKPIKTDTVYKSKIGSAANADHVRKAVWDTEADRMSGGAFRYEFLNTSTAQDDKSGLHKSILSRTGMHLADFSNPDAQNDYFYSLVK